MVVLVRMRPRRWVTDVSVRICDGFSRIHSCLVGWLFCLSFVSSCSILCLKPVKSQKFVI